MTDPVVLRFPDSTGSRVGTLRLPWFRDKALKLYLHEPAPRAEGLLSRSFRCYIYRENNEKVRLSYRPKPGETLTFVYAPRI